MSSDRKSLQLTRNKLIRRKRVRNVLIATLILVMLFFGWTVSFLINQQRVRAELPGGELTFLQIESSFQHTCAVASDHTAHCWGNNGNGQLGDGTTTVRNSPTPVDTTGVLADLSIKSVHPGYYHSCAIASDERAYCWGLTAAGWGMERLKTLRSL